ncbi:hypothetical protein L1987_70233 [Smallanthus sonchifolius]|uniref:Uncharacterized protein n=1 Tax=Smallanthus sonchifolius TaxID=185202 RepID=A0ACB9AQM8_9ASTR|nr:hypothetical protein L1987_70233 [Smallanthus sonchifolius]
MYLKTMTHQHDLHTSPFCIYNKPNKQENHIAFIPKFDHSLHRCFFFALLLVCRGFKHECNQILNKIL